ncbi:MAG: ABC transporter permease subunit [Candidatus Glassbacteria bacterium]
MFGSIVLKELISNILSLRFTLSLAISLVLFTAGSVVFVQRYYQEMEEYATVTNANLQELGRAADDGLAAVSSQVQTIRTRPQLTGLFCSGFQNSMPNVFKTDVFRTFLPEVQTAGNFYIPHSRDLDWMLVVTLVLSFFAVLLTFDSLSGERERGTLPLALSNSVPRDLLLAGKYVGALLTLVIPLALGMLVSLIITSLSGLLYSPLEWLKIGVFILVSLLFLSVFLLLGMLVSSRVSSSSTSIVALLFLWVVTILIIPSGSKLIAQKLVSAPSRAQVEKEAQDAHLAIWQDPNKEAKFGEFCGNWSSNWDSNKRVNPPARARLFNAFADSYNRIYLDYVKRMEIQVETGRQAALVSPLTVYQRLAEALFGTGVAGFRSMYGQVNDYRAALKQFLADEDKKDPNSLHIFAWDVSMEDPRIFSHNPVDFNSLLRFQPKELSLAESLKAASWDIATLVILNLLLFAAVFVQFLRSDVRQR